MYFLIFRNVQKRTKISQKGQKFIECFSFSSFQGYFLHKLKIIRRKNVTDDCLKSAGVFEIFFQKIMNVPKVVKNWIS